MSTQLTSCECSANLSDNWRVVWIHFPKFDAQRNYPWRKRCRFALYLQSTFAKNNFEYANCLSSSFRPLGWPTRESNIYRIDSHESLVQLSPRVQNGKLSLGPESSNVDIYSLRHQRGQIFCRNFCHSLQSNDFVEDIKFRLSV